MRLSVRFPPIADVPVVRQLVRMNGRKAIALCWWTFGYLLIAATLFLLSSAPDCLPGAEGAACRALGRQVQIGILVALAIAYVVLTWGLFFRRR